MISLKDNIFHAFNRTHQSLLDHDYSVSFSTTIYKPSEFSKEDKKSIAETLRAGISQKSPQEAHSSLDSDNHGNHELLKMAIIQGDLFFVKEFLKKHNEQDISEELIIIAIDMQRPEVIDLLLESQAKIAKNILDEKPQIDIKCKDSKGNTALMLAVKSFNLSALEDLLGKGVDVGERNNQGQTALMIAKNMLEIVLNNQDYYLKNYPDMEDKNDKNAKNLRKMVSILKEHSKKSKQNLRDEIVNEFKKNSLQQQQEEAINEIKLEEETSWGEIIKEKEEAREHIEDVEKKSTQDQKKIEEIDNNGRTPIMLAVLNKDLEKTRALIDEGADVNVGDQLGRTPLHILAEKGSTVDIAKCIISSNSVDINKQDKFGDTPLISAIEGKNFDLINMLLEKGADINIRNNEGKTALTIAKRMKEYIANPLNPTSSNDINTDVERMKSAISAIKKSSIRSRMAAVENWLSENTTTNTANKDDKSPTSPQTKNPSNKL